MGVANVVLALTAVAIPAAAAPQEPAGVKDLRAALSEGLAATVFVKVERSFRGRIVRTGGSGFFIGSKGILLTNWHVVAPQVEVDYDGRKAEIATAIGAMDVVVSSGTPGERSLRAKVVALDRDRDLALLSVPGPAPAVLSLADTAVQLADEVWVLGYPFGELLAANQRNPEVTATSGRVTSIRHDAQGRPTYVQFDAVANPGNSGGPVLDTAGRVAGVVTKGIQGAGTSFAVPLEQVRQFVTANQVSINFRPAGVYVRSEPIVVTVAPLLLDLEGRTCEVELSGNDIPSQRIALSSQGGRLHGTLRVPERLPNAPRATSYQVVLYLSEPEGTTRFRRALTLPVLEDAHPTVGSARDPAAIMRDRQDLANRREGGRPVGAPDPAPDPAVKHANPLAELAKSVTLKKNPDGSVPVLTMEEVATCNVSLDPNRYAALPSQHLSTLARAYDLAECEFTRLRSLVLDQEAILASGENYYSCSRQRERTRAGSATDAGRIFAEKYDPAGRTSPCGRYEAEGILSANHALAEKAQEKLLEQRQPLEAHSLCRCSSGQWHVRASPSRCRECVTPGTEQ